jgi:hypothetical protein
LEPLIDKLTDFSSGSFNSGTLRVVLTNESNGVLSLLEGKPEHLIKVLVKLKPRDLKVVLTNGGNKILNLLVGTAENGNPEHLVNVICCLNFKDLHEILTKYSNKILNLLVSAAGKNPEHLANVLRRLDPEDLVKILTDNQDKILNSFKEKPEYLIEELRDLSFWGLDEVRMDEISIFL